MEMQIVVHTKEDFLNNVKIMMVQLSEHYDSLTMQGDVTLQEENKVLASVNFLENFLKDNNVNASYELTDEGTQVTFK